MTDDLDRWVQQATRCLSKDSAVQVATEIREHYECARDAAIKSGSTSDKAHALSLTALGDAKRANRQYRKVLLTSWEARLLREGNWESRAICSRPIVKWLLLCVPVVAILVGIKLLHSGAIKDARVLLFGGTWMTLWLVPPFLPIYTPARSRVVRYLKWIALAAWPILPFGTPLLVASLWPLLWIEWTRISIRRKLPIGRWPKHLYF